jgi:DNA-binding transcriptional regulator YdaS (Cro superfamily)
MEALHPIDRAARTIGSQAALGSLFDLGKAAVSQWKEEGRRVPAEYCPRIEGETRRIAAERGDPSLIVTCEELRPDVAWDVLRMQAGVEEPTPKRATAEV